MRILGVCAFTAGGATLLHGLLGDPSRHPAHAVDLSLLDRQAALATTGGTLCVIGTILLVGAVLAGRLDRMREAVCPTTAAPVPGPSHAGCPDDDDYAGYPSGAWVDLGRRTWRARGGE